MTLSPCTSAAIDSHTGFGILNTSQQVIRSLTGPYGTVQTSNHEVLDLKQTGSPDSEHLTVGFKIIQYLFMTRKCKLDGLLSSGFQPSMFRFERYSVVSFQDLQRMS